MRILKSTLRLIAMISMLILIVAKNPIAGVVLLASSSMSLGILITERANMKNNKRE